MATLFPGSGDDGLAAKRRRLVVEITREVAELAGALGTAALDPDVLRAIGTVPRECFVPEDLRDRAYENRPLPIGEGQTISQPFIVALMTHLLGSRRGDRVLDVGTGSGYQAAILAALGVEVYSIELNAGLSRGAGVALERAGLRDVRLRVGDGHAGWPEAAPFDGIVLAAAATEMPLVLRDQLAVGGRFVLPLEKGRGRQPSGLFGETDQELVTVRRDSSTEFVVEGGLPVAFVPFRSA